MSEIIKTYQEIAQNVGKYYHYKNAELSFLRLSSGRINENAVCISLKNPKKMEYPNEISAMLLNTGDGLKVIRYFMSKYYLFEAAQEEKAMYPENYKIYQDEDYSYVVEDAPSDIPNIAKLFKIFNTFESKFLSEKTHCKYEKLSDYIGNYKTTNDAIVECIAKNESSEIIEHFRKENTYEKQILEPLAKACSVLLNKSDYSYTQKNTPYGTFVILRFSKLNDSEETGICLLLNNNDGTVTIKKATGQNPAGGYTTVDLPDNIAEILSFMQTKPKTSAARA